jgi:hypothetical protein
MKYVTCIRALLPPRRASSTSYILLQCYYYRSTTVNTLYVLSRPADLVSCRGLKVLRKMAGACFRVGSIRAILCLLLFWRLIARTPHSCVGSTLFIGVLHSEVGTTTFLDLAVKLSGGPAAWWRLLHLPSPWCVLLRLCDSVWDLGVQLFCAAVCSSWVRTPWRSALNRECAVAVHQWCFEVASTSSIALDS